MRLLQKSRSIGDKSKQPENKDESSQGILYETRLLKISVIVLCLILIISILATIHYSKDNEKKPSSRVPRSLTSNTRTTSLKTRNVTVEPCSLSGTEIICSNIYDDTSRVIAEYISSNSDKWTEKSYQLQIKNCDFPYNTLTSGWLPLSISISIDQLHITNCVPTTIAENAFNNDHFENVTNLILENNIARLNKNCFAGLKNLQMLDLNINGSGLQYIGDNILNSVSNILTTLRIQTGINDAKLKKLLTNVKLEKLQTIHISLNYLYKLNFSTFQGLTNLVEFDAMLSQLKYLESSTFSAFASTIQQIILSNNNLESLPRDIFNIDSKRINFKVFLNGNQLKTLPEGIFDKAMENSQKVALEMAENHWNCSCELAWLHELIQNGKIQLDDLPECESPKIKGSKLLFMDADFSFCAAASDNPTTTTHTILPTLTTSPTTEYISSTILTSSTISSTSESETTSSTTEPNLSTENVSSTLTSQTTLPTTVVTTESSSSTVLTSSTISSTSESETTISSTTEPNFPTSTLTSQETSPTTVVTTESSTSTILTSSTISSTSESETIISSTTEQNFPTSTLTSQETSPTTVVTTESSSSTILTSSTTLSTSESETTIPSTTEPYFPTENVSSTLTSQTTLPTTIVTTILTSSTTLSTSESETTILTTEPNLSTENVSSSETEGTTSVITIITEITSTSTDASDAIKKYENINCTCTTCNDNTFHILTEITSFQASPLSYNSIKDFYIVEDDLNKKLQIKITSDMDHYLLWMNTEEATYIKCNYTYFTKTTRDPNGVYLAEFATKPNTSYTVCAISQDVTVSPLNCRAYTTLPAEGERAWLIMNQQTMIWSIFCGALLVSLVIGGGAIYTVVRHYPRLIKGNKRVIVVRHRAGEVMVMPKEYCLTTKRDNTFRRNSDTSYYSARTSSTSYVTAIQPTPVQLIAWKFNRMWDRLMANGETEDTKKIPTKITPPVPPYPNDVSNEGLYEISHPCDYNSLYSTVTKQNERS